MENNLEERLNDLEMKYSYQDNLVNELNIIVADQQRIIDHLLKEMKALMTSISDTAGSQHNTSLADDKPPHY